MNNSFNKFTPSAYARYEQIKEDIKNPDTVRWIDRFLHKYELSSSYVGIRVEHRDAIFSRYSTLLGVFLSYKAFEDIANFCYENEIINDTPDYYLSCNDLIHRQITSNKVLIEYMLDVAKNIDDTEEVLIYSLTEGERNVMIFGRLIAEAIGRNDFNAKNLGITISDDKRTLRALKNHIDLESNHLFSMAVAEMKQKLKVKPTQLLS
jgi:hypothetical protein